MIIGLEKKVKVKGGEGVRAASVGGESVPSLIVEKKAGKKKRRRKKKAGGAVGIAPPEEDGKKEAKEDEMEDVLAGVKVPEAGEKKEKAKLDVNPLKNMQRAKVVTGKDPDEVVDNYDFGYEVDGKDIEQRRSFFKKEANLTKSMLYENRNIEDDKIEGGGLDQIMDMFVEKEEEKGKEKEKEEEEEEEEEKTSIVKEAAALEEKAEEEVKEVREEGEKAKEEEEEEKKKAKAKEEEEEKKKKAKAKEEEEKKKEELVPKWRDPLTGTVVDVDKRKEYLKKSKPFRECWEGVLAKCVQSLGKSELERRVAELSREVGRLATPSMCFCALAECNGVVRHAKTKLQLPGYREEMSLAEEVCQTSQYVKVTRKKKASPDGKKGKSPKKGKRASEDGAAEAAAQGGEAKEKRGEAAFWRDPVSGEVMDGQARKQHLLKSATYKSCWEEVLGKLVQSSGKGDIEKNIARICSTVKSASPEIAFCSLAECNGQAQHSIVKLRHPGYLEEMRLAVEVCQVSQYVKVSPKKKKGKKSPKKGGE